MQHKTHIPEPVGAKTTKHQVITSVYLFRIRFLRIVRKGPVDSLNVDAIAINHNKVRYSSNIEPVRNQAS